MNGLAKYYRLQASKELQALNIKAASMYLKLANEAKKNEPSKKK